MAKGVKELFQHLHYSLLFGRISRGRDQTDSVLRVNGKPLITPLVIGSNGYFVTAFPVSKKKSQG